MNYEQCQKPLKAPICLKVLVNVFSFWGFAIWDDNLFNLGTVTWVLMLSCQDFANNAASFSACPGTKSNGGDLGEAQRDAGNLVLPTSLTFPDS